MTNISSSVLTPPVRVEGRPTPSLAPDALSQARSSPLHAIAVPSAAFLFTQYSVCPARGGELQHLPPRIATGEVELRFTVAGSGWPLSEMAQNLKRRDPGSPPPGGSG